MQALPAQCRAARRQAVMEEGSARPLRRGLGLAVQCQAYLGGPESKLAWTPRGTGRPASMVPKAASMVPKTASMGACPNRALQGWRRGGHDLARTRPVSSACRR